MKPEITPNNTAGILLAAGAARRFGGDKLSAQIEGRSVLDRSASTLSRAGCFINAGVIAPNSDHHGEILDSNNMSTLVNARASFGVSESIKIGVHWAIEHGAKAVLITLADMPFVSYLHIQKLFDYINNDASIAFTMDGNEPMPPIIFGERWFEQLLLLHGDKGAKQLLSLAPESAGIFAASETLADIDVPENLNI